MSASFFAELKRRNVIRVAVAYVAVSWLLAQGIAQLAPVVGRCPSGPRAGSSSPRASAFRSGSRSRGSTS